jgi:hypothetical protein
MFAHQTYTSSSEFQGHSICFKLPRNVKGKRRNAVVDRWNEGMKRYYKMIKAMNSDTTILHKAGS